MLTLPPHMMANSCHRAQSANVRTDALDDQAVAPYCNVASA